MSEAGHMNLPAKNTRSLEEVQSEIDSFSEADWLRLQKSAKLLRRGSEQEADDLLHDALVKALDGTRLCPTHVSVLHFLAQSMKSIGSSDNKKSALRAKLHLVPKTGGEEAQDIIDTIPDQSQTPEEAVASTQNYEYTMQALKDLFSDDVVAMTIIEGDVEGISAMEIRELLDLDIKQFASHRRRVRRKIEGAINKGKLQ